MSGGFFPAPEAIIAALGPAQAVLYGRIWRYCQGGGTCYASIATLAGECGVSRPTVCRWIGELVDTGYITRQSGQAAGKTSVLVTTRKWVAGGVSEVDRGADQNLTGGVYQNLTTKRRFEDKSITTGAPPAEHVTADIAQTAAPKRVRVPSPWSAFRTTVLDSYGQASNKGTQSLATRIIQTAEHHGLEPEDAARAWQRWRTATTADDTARYWPIHRAAEGWGAWLQERRASARPMPIRAAAMGRVESREVTA